MNENEVWAATLDDMDVVTVTCEAPYRGILRTTEEGVLHSETVGLMYDALFGPDVDDVDRWQEIAIRLVDSRR